MRADLTRTAEALAVAVPVAGWLARYLLPPIMKVAVIPRQWARYAVTEQNVAE